MRDTSREPAENSKDAGYETTDASAPAIVVSGVVLAVSLLLVLGTAWGTLEFFRYRTRIAQPELSPLHQAQDLGTRPPLQPAPLRDYEEFAAEQAAQLNRYGVQDKATSTVRIPIERAMQVIAERGNAATAPAKRLKK